MGNKDSIFFLHIPKTAGTAFNKIFRGRFGDRYFDHMESRQLLLNQVLDDGQPFFASGHFLYWEKKNVILRPDVYSITILRDPVLQLISHLKWVKAHGDVNNIERHRVLPPSLAEFAIRLWKTSLNDIDALEEIMSLPMARQLFDNVQTRYLANQYQGNIGEKQLEEALINYKSFDLIFTLDDIESAVENIGSIYGSEQKIEYDNIAKIDEEVELRDVATMMFYHNYTRMDGILYENVKRYSRKKFFKE